MEIANYAGELPPSASLGPIASMLVPDTASAPIDMYRRSIRSFLDYGSPTNIAAAPFIGRLLVLGIVSAAEGYFRGILSACMEMCPVAQAGASAKQIHLGGLLWHGKTGFSRSAFEHSSFSSASDLKKVFKDYLSFELDDGKFKSLLQEFEAVCQIRHGIVHGDGMLPGRNAVLLDVPRFTTPVRITVGYAELQDIAAVVTSLVATVNRELFSEMCARWAGKWRRRADWDPAIEVKRFGEIWSVFHSQEEARTRRGRTKLTKAKCMADVRIEHSI